MQMKTIGIETLTAKGQAVYADENLAFVNRTEVLAEIFGGSGVKPAFAVCVVCLQGKLRITVDNAALCVGSRQAMVCPINSLLSDYMSTPDFRGVAICASPGVFKELYVNKQMWKYYQYVLCNHIIAFEEEDWLHLAAYHALMNEQLRRLDENRFGRQIIRSLWQTVIYEFLSILDRYIPRTKQASEQAVSSEILSARFMELLAVSEGRIHTVTEFADKLFVAPKYLSASVKRTTGKTALQWILETVAKEAERRLKHSECSIKEIADALNFPNPSFFGKFVKMRLGNTPAKIRNGSRKG